ncbi:7-carboxy-7-deazaguanine synthase QueE [uncultured Arcticibacterium sp.]|uniref:7-carboxy-7-deazaguanine synthase QueE n=1 Tax=uncultured Arcticibacterium sp. TaxID=2173042 RepID=UPI0030F7505F
MDSTQTAIDLPIMESFYTIQGEGVHNGKAAYFIRLGGCDVGCVWCDVKESWDAEKHPLTSIDTLMAEAKEHPGRLVVITGGEPLMYDMLPLTEALRSEGFETNIETSGAYEMSGAWDWVCFSPKKFKEPHNSIFPVANELKAIIFNKSDFAFAEKYAELVNDDCQLLLQPEWDKQEQMLPLIIDYVKANPKWKISLQTHKFMDIP